ncbi:MAG: hypothetical protein FWD77_11325 [Betaproteobacteria bacterium]|nr:hypothetical protein [Betaproteobacteria bacterium]
MFEHLGLREALSGFSGQASCYGKPKKNQTVCKYAKEENKPGAMGGTTLIRSKKALC